MSYIHTPRKRFGQNFLTDLNICADIVARVYPQPEQYILEIGPGQGAITQGLLATGAHIDAVELDRDLVAYLTSRFGHYNNFTLHHADILAFDLVGLASNCPHNKLRLVGNLPYNISTPLLFKLFSNMQHITDMHFMLQLEVAERLVAEPGNKQYGRMSVMAQYFCQMQIVLAVPPSAFDPAPKVQSAVVRFVPHVVPKVIADDIACLQTITTAAFNQRRKTIGNAVKHLLNLDDLAVLGIDSKLRAENLSLAEYVHMSNLLKQKANSIHR